MRFLEFFNKKLNMSWRVPKIWNDKTTCYVIGGGPSLKNIDLSILKHKHIIAVNNSYQLVPWADFLFFMDKEWITQHSEQLRRFNGIISTILLEHEKYSQGLRGIKVIKRGQRDGFSTSNRVVNHGGNSGFCAINLAGLLGAGRIILVGFDMRVVNGQHNYHTEHYRRINNDIYETEYIKPFSTLSGISILNATPNSAIKCFEFVSLEDTV